MRPHSANDGPKRGFVSDGEFHQPVALGVRPVLRTPNDIKPRFVQLFPVLFLAISQISRGSGQVTRLLQGTHRLDGRHIQMRFSFSLPTIGCRHRILMKYPGVT
jgi:hypothetical protein